MARQERLPGGHRDATATGTGGGGRGRPPQSTEGQAATGARGGSPPREAAWGTACGGPPQEPTPAGTPWGGRRVRRCWGRHPPLPDDVRARNPPSPHSSPCPAGTLRPNRSREVRQGLDRPSVPVRTGGASGSGWQAGSWNCPIGPAALARGRADQGGPPRSPVAGGRGVPRGGSRAGARAPTGAGARSAVPGPGGRVRPIKGDGAHAGRLRRGVAGDAGAGGRWPAWRPGSAPPCCGACSTA